MPPKALIRPSSSAAVLDCPAYSQARGKLFEYQYTAAAVHHSFHVAPHHCQGRLQAIVPAKPMVCFTVELLVTSGSASRRATPDPAVLPSPASTCPG